VDPISAEPDANSANNSRRSGSLLLLLIGAGYLAYWQVVPRIKSGELWVVLLSTLISLSLAVWLAAQIARSQSGSRSVLIGLAVTAACIIPLKTSVAWRQPLAPWTLLAAVPGLPDVLFIWFGACLGALLSRLLRGLNLVPPVAAALALVDIWTVLLGGPVQQIMQSDNPVAKAATQAMTVPLPRPEVVANSAMPFQMQVGFADFLFIAFFVAALTRFVPEARAYRQTLASLVVTLALYMGIVIYWSIDLPALLPMAAVVLAVNWRRFQYTRSEKFAMAYALVAVGTIVFAFWRISRSGSEGGGPETRGDSGPQASLRVDAPLHGSLRNAPNPNHVGG
jgi:hypothetical protein